MEPVILVFGNPLLEEDSVALKVGAGLKRLGWDVVFCEDPVSILDYVERPIVILDAVKGLKEVKVLEPSDVKTRSAVTLHDLDLGFFLKLLDVDVKIIGIPL
ncbi:MAG: hypothetical protein DRP11_01615 [Candidatus Aenigmatarchaeota archaeon]|nr:MAG: hypothetical protein DRP11_01615 [Candidatus Aenigmarchaeota archaeon]